MCLFYSTNKLKCQIMDCVFSFQFHWFVSEYCHKARSRTRILDSRLFRQVSAVKGIFPPKNKIVIH